MPEINKERIHPHPIVRSMNFHLIIEPSFTSFLFQMKLPRHLPNTMT